MTANPQQRADADIGALAAFMHRHARLFVLTGAGCSTGSGIPDYRDRDGAWKRRQPVTFQAFMSDPLTRARYWARSMLGWPLIGRARPNGAHAALARLEQQGRLSLLVTQNVDRLHQAAGSVDTLDLHGRLDRLVCTGCGASGCRHGFQRRLLDCNPAWQALRAASAPDGDADLDGMDFAAFRIPACPNCGGVFKPDVVFFGENVSRDRVGRAMTALESSDGVLVVGSSLMVWSGYRFALAAAERRLPMAAINLGRSRADALFALKVRQPCETALAAVV